MEQSDRLELDEALVELEGMLVQVFSSLRHNIHSINQKELALADQNLSGMIFHLRKSLGVTHGANSLQ